MKFNQINEQEKVYDAFKGIDAIITLSQQYKENFKRFFHLDLKKMENELVKIGRCSVLMVINRETNLLNFEDLFSMIETLMETNDDIRKNFLNKVSDEKEKAKYTQFLTRHIIDKIKINIEDCIEGRLKL